MKVGAWVRCERSTPPRGTWSRYSGRVGRVVQINRADGEYGVKFTASGDEVTTWFVADELVAITRPATVPSILLHSERGAGLQATGSPLRAANAA